MSNAHFNYVCPSCRKVMSTCRCAAKDKQERLNPTLCADCKKLAQEDYVNKVQGRVEPKG